MTQPTVSLQSVTAGGIKPEHYPSVELCNKLTEMGFPTTYIMEQGDTDSDRYKKYVCPSVMEMLDVMPDIIEQEYQLYFWKNNDMQYGVLYQEVYGKHGLGECGKGFETLPNALAEMWIWLKENKYI